VPHDLAVLLAEQHHGVVSRSALRAVGMNRFTVADMWRSLTWEPVTSEVARLRGTPRSTGQRLACATLDAGTGAHLSHLTAARWWGLTGCPSRPVHVVRVGTSTRQPELAVLHRVRRLPETWTTELDGIPVVRPELCALQLFACCRPQRAERLVERMWSDRLLSGRSLRRFLRDMGRMGRNGTAGLRAYLDERPDDYAPPASGIESRTLQILEGAGIEVRRQVDLGDDEVWTGRVDFLVVGLPIVIEVQSERHHLALTDRRADDERRRRLTAAGFVVVEVTDTEVWTTPNLVVERVRAAIACARTS
jgi:very-short-patch-repair endonuclease